MSPRRGLKPRLTDRLVVGRNVTLTLKSFSDVIEVIIGFSSLVWSYEEVLTQYGGYVVNC
jgi:hypothetical protein